MNYRIHVPDSTEGKILIELDTPECSPEDLEELKRLSRDLSLQSFLEWVEWMPIRDEDKEWAYWEARSPNPSLADYVKFLENRNKELEEEAEAGKQGSHGKARREKAGAEDGMEADR